MMQEKSLATTLKALLYLAPALIILVVFNIYPIITSFLMSLYTDYDYYHDIVYRYGFDNFLFLLQDEDFHLALRNTFIFVLGVVPASITLSLFIALLLNTNIKLRGFFRTIYFIPFVTSVVAISIVWRWIFHTEYGLLNYFLSWFGVSPIKWLTDPKWAMPSLIILAIWKGLGYNIVIFLAGLQNIPEHYYLAARIDRASRWQRFWNITWPLLSPTTFFVSIISVIGSFKVFDEIYALFDGRPGPVRSALTVVYYIFEKFYREQEYAVASAAAYVLFLIVFILTLLQLYIGKKRVHY
ncbi:MAG: sugar ABC transporter permease [Candidatus Carbobacillus altaicus]|uniref:Sugar ABC transporter ABC transport system, permease protein 1 n=1 Tax=Candidatus Carbonibacillus altaicus TaxID=2163959 RepID=A0A2R6Y031_9BACL|nr:sugar ABC transporter permease [Candidatus Carbobacillus altaicus]PTQ56033.1 MAG: Sugar ABC transporter ABC transport system, permease protein 1 [Candidatus Carbobacillus altaicus]